MRVAIVEVIGHLISELAGAGEDDGQDRKQVQKQINGLYDLLLERMLDVSSYVRAKVLVVLSKLCDLKVKFPKQRLAITRAAVSALEDKAASVRKWAVSLLVKLLLTHPYGMMHGGFLELDIWEAEYLVAKAELAKVEDAMGKAVERNDGDEDDDDDDGSDGEDEHDDEGDGEEGNTENSERKKKR